MFFYRAGRHERGQCTDSYDTGSGGLGIAGYSVDNVGGDLFVPSCQASPGVRPTFLLGTEVDYAVNLWWKRF